MNNNANKRVVFVVAPEGFNDSEFLQTKKVLEGEGVKVAVASTVKGECIGLRGTTVNATLELKEVDPSRFDGIVAVGGAGALKYLSENRDLINLFKRFNQMGRVVAAIGRARHALHNAGLFGTNFAWGPPVEIYGKVIAGRPPSTTPGWTSKKFGEIILRHL